MGGKAAMSQYIVIEVPTPSALRRGRVRAFGPYDDAEGAEQARRRRHLDNLAASKWSQPQTFVAEIEEPV
jgi:hypothetical protein